jgi:hypothetical protein
MALARMGQNLLARKVRVRMCLMNYKALSYDKTNSLSSKFILCYAQKLSAIDLAL